MVYGKCLSCGGPLFFSVDRVCEHCFVRHWKGLYRPARLERGFVYRYRCLGCGKVFKSGVGQKRYCPECMKRRNYGGESHDADALS